MSDDTSYDHLILPDQPNESNQKVGASESGSAESPTARSAAEATESGSAESPKPRSTAEVSKAKSEDVTGVSEHKGGPQTSEYERRPDDLPDFTYEGVATGEVGIKAEVHFGRPKIGDSRPARIEDGTHVASKDQVPPRTGARSSAVNGSPGVVDSAEVGSANKRRRRRGGRGRGRDESNEPVTMQTSNMGSVKVSERMSESRRGDERDGKPLGRYLMAVHVRGNATQIAVLEGRQLIEHYVSFPADDVWQIDGNIYLGRVQNVLPGMEAAFVEIGTPKNAVLYRGDVRYESDYLDTGDEQPSNLPRSNNGGQRIEQMLKNGQTLLCQVTKNPIGAKGARLTQEVSLPGRFVVFIPNSSTYGISKRLTDDERKRLRKVLDSVKPEGHGMIVRTAAQGATAEELRRDVQRLYEQWTKIERLAESSKAPKLLYREPNTAVRIIREEFNRDFRGVVIDDRELYDEVRSYVAGISPEMAERVEYHDAKTSALPIFEHFHIHEQIHRALDRKVWLASGGSLIIERTEALTVIDVNTGKNVGKSSLEETVFQNNLEAADEIARQLRLRDIGGIIVIDFIDMEISSNRAKVISAFREALARDKTRTQVFDISELGLVEMTRKRVSEGLVESFSQKCPSCDGRGFVYDQTLL